jgi:hypothetical protein
LGDEEDFFILRRLIGTHLCMALAERLVKVICADVEG